MKKSMFIGMMTIMMVFCSTVSYAQCYNGNNNCNYNSNCNINNNCNYNSNCNNNCDGYRGSCYDRDRYYDRRPAVRPAAHHQMRPHRHVFNRYDVCKICRMTERQIIRMEREMRRHNPNHRPGHCY